MLRCHSVHRIFYVLKCARTGSDVQHREVRNARLILLEKCQLCGVGREEDTVSNTKLVTADTLTTYDVLILKSGYCFVVFAIEQIEIILDCVGEQRAVVGLVSDVCNLLILNGGEGVLRENASALEVDGVDLPHCANYKITSLVEGVAGHVCKCVTKQLVDLLL